MVTCRAFVVEGGPDLTRTYPACCGGPGCHRGGNLRAGGSTVAGLTVSGTDLHTPVNEVFEFR